LFTANRNPLISKQSSRRERNPPRSLWLWVLVGEVQDGNPKANQEREDGGNG